MSKLQLHALVLIVFCGLTLAVTKVAEPSQQTQVRTDFAAIPMVMGGWTLLEELEFDSETQRLLPSSSLLLRMYEHSDYELPAELAIVYGVDLGNFHQPEICLEGQGLRSQSKRLVSVKNTTDGSSFRAMSLIMESENGRRAFLYWFMSGGTTSTSLGNYKTKVMVDRLMLRRVAPSAMIRLSTGVTDGDEAAEKELISFAESAMPYLEKEFSRKTAGDSATAQ